MKVFIKKIEFEQIDVQTKIDREEQYILSHYIVHYQLNIGPHTLEGQISFNKDCPINLMEEQIEQSLKDYL